MNAKTAKLLNKYAAAVTGRVTAIKKIDPFSDAGRVIRRRIGRDVKRMWKDTDRPHKNALRRKVQVELLKLQKEGT